MIRTFFFGDIAHLPQADLLFPILIVTPLPGDIVFDDPGYINLKLNLSILDKLIETDDSNLRYILDNCLNLLINIVTELSEDESFNITNTPYEWGYPELSDYILAGASITLTIQESLSNCKKLLDFDVE